MPDEVTASRDAASGFGATAQTNDNAEQIADLLDQVRDLMIEDGADAATAEALTNFARPATPAFAGNLADLNRMGQIAVTGKIDTPPGEDDIETTDISDAFVEPPAPALAPAGLQTPMGQIDAEGNPVAGAEGRGAGGLSAMTKAELLDEASARGVDVSASASKAEIIAALEG